MTKRVTTADKVLDMDTTLDYISNDLTTSFHIAGESFVLLRGERDARCSERAHHERS